MIFYDFLPFHVIIPELMPHVGRHYHEMKTGDSYGEPDVDWDSYFQASTAGQCYVATVREDNELVGYSIYSVGNNLRYKTKIDANNEAVYLEKSYRGIGKKLIAKAENCLTLMGVDEINYITNDQALIRLLKSINYEPDYQVCSKRLKGFKNGQQKH